MLVDGTALNTHLMRNPVAMKLFLRKLAAVAEMHVVGMPVPQAYPWPGTADREALSAVCFLAESSITVHCHPEREFVFVDIFSCKDFDEDGVKWCVANSFAMPEPSVLILDRGIDDNGECIPASIRKGGKYG